MNFAENNFIVLLKNFTKKEITEFEKFVNSPFFNTQNSLSELLKELISHYPEFKGDSFTKIEIFSAAFPEKKFNDVLFRKYMSNLMKLAEDYLVCKDILGNGEKREISLLDQFDNKNLTHFFERQLAKIEKNTELKKSITVETFYYKHFREELKAGYYIKINKIYEIKSCLIRSHVYVLLHMLMLNIVYANMMLIVKKTYKNDENNNYFDEFNDTFDLIGYLEKIQDLDENEKMFIALCRIDLLISKDPYDLKNLKDMKSIILKMSDVLSDNLLYTFFSHLNIYYLLNLSLNSIDLTKDFFENYKFMIEKGLYDRKGNEFINYSEYRTILNYAVRLKELDWLEKFILRFKDQHEYDIKDSLNKYSMALLNFERKNYEVSLKYLSELKVNFVIMKLDVDILLLLIYYELGYTESALSLIDSMRHFLGEEKHFSNTVKDNHHNFLKFYRILLMNKDNPKIQVLINLKLEIINCTNLRRKYWLLEKIEV
ncbi:MAG TPA: hypothetical protein PKA90_06420 [Ignavibacteria bacterium]|nr:hypothetical protein [Ignavibacteria bacterium]HMR40050.1 hypothetical protein [Ignavibacteria bacterium]